MRWDPYDTFERNGFTVEVFTRPCDSHPMDMFESDNMAEILDKIDTGVYDWFDLKVVVSLRGIELGWDSLHGNLYEDARDIEKDGVLNDVIEMAMIHARSSLDNLKEALAS